MRKVKLYIASSLDGFIARKDGSLDWLTELPGTDATDHGYKEFYETIDTVIMGRKTYDAIVGFNVEWPYANCHTFVVSRSDHHKIKTDDTILLTENIVETIQAMKRSTGKDIWLVGGGEVVSLCLENQLIDEIIQSIAPVILGEGIQLFPGIKREVPLTFEEVTSYSTGIVTMKYQIK